MKMDTHGAEEIALEVGADRVVAPPGFLPQPAETLDSSGPVRPHELEISVERLCLDSTSHRQIAESADGDADAMAARILEIVSERGKMHNPVTDSGGILTGAASAVGSEFPNPPEIGAPVVTLASLTLTPLRLDEVTAIDPASPQVGVRGTAYVCASAAWTERPADLTLEKALEVLDVCAAASHTRDLVPVGGSVCVMGAGHAGKLALAAARDASLASTLTVVDLGPRRRHPLLRVRPRRHRRRHGPARSPRSSRGDPGRRGAAGGSHCGRRECDRL